MHLLSVGLTGFRRFRGNAGDLDVSSHPIAIVGPNEVGKTSFLRSLLHLNEPGPFAQRDLTRNGDGSAEVRAVFALEPSDEKAIAALGGVGRPVIFNLSNEGGDRHSASLVPPLTRDKTSRRAAVGHIERLVKTRWARTPETEPLTILIAEIREVLAGEGETLDEGALSKIREVASQIREVDGAIATAISLAERLSDLATVEGREHPNDAARNLMYGRRPSFLWFDEDRRQIESSFSLDDGPSPALSDLFDLIGFDLEALDRATADGDRPRIAELTNDARERFRSLFAERWRQTRVRVELDVEGRGVHVFATNTNGSLIPIAERSEGLRQFIALMTFVERNATNGRDVIVLIDEAEQHLHYDAQADLVRVFSSRTKAKKIIYSTHSAGCLPHDLGMGIRVIEATGPKDVAPEEWESSRLTNWFWQRGPGYSPLLMAMGAGTFAFASTRKAIVAEGISDALLLPTLFREALELDTLDLQVAPGLANISRAAAGELDFIAARVVYLVDGDEGGSDQRRMLIDVGVPPERIIRLGLGQRDVTLEDLLDERLYMDAVNRVLELRQLPHVSIDLPSRRRKRAIELWAERTLPRGRADAPSERAVAHHLLQFAQEGRLRGETVRIGDARFREMLASLYRKAEESLTLPRDDPTTR